MHAKVVIFNVCLQVGTGLGESVVSG
jgi:hypothetical protein